MPKITHRLNRRKFPAGMVGAGFPAMIRPGGQDLLQRQPLEFQGAESAGRDSPGGAHCQLARKFPPGMVAARAAMRGDIGGTMPAQIFAVPWSHFFFFSLFFGRPGHGGAVRARPISHPRARRRSKRLYGCPRRRHDGKGRKHPPGMIATWLRIPGTIRGQIKHERPPCVSGHGAAGGE